MWLELIQYVHLPQIHDHLFSKLLQKECFLRSNYLILIHDLIMVGHLNFSVILFFL